MKNKRVEFAIIVALLGTGGRVLFKKIGGNLSGGIHSDSHTWAEIAGMIPEFFLFFIILFSFAYVVPGKKPTNAHKSKR